MKYKKNVGITQNPMFFLQWFATFVKRNYKK